MGILLGASAKGVPKSRVSFWSSVTAASCPQVWIPLLLPLESMWARSIVDCFQATTHRVTCGETVSGDVSLGLSALKVKLGTWVLYQLLSIALLKHCAQSKLRKKGSFGYHFSVEFILAGRVWQQEQGVESSHFVCTWEAERERGGGKNKEWAQVSSPHSLHPALLLQRGCTSQGF